MAWVTDIDIDIDITHVGVDVTHFDVDIDISFPKPAPESLSYTAHKRQPLHLLCTPPDIDIDIVARWCTLHLLCTQPGNKLSCCEMKN